MDDTAADIDSCDFQQYDEKVPLKGGQSDGTISLPITTFQIIKNLLIVSIGFLFLFTSYASLENLQSSLNKEAGLGTVGLAVIYLAMVISSMFLPSFIIDYIGCKWTVAFSMLAYIPYIVANFYATWWTIILSTVILGLGAAPLWTAKCTYLTEMGTWYAKLTGYKGCDIISRFFGVFFLIFQASQVLGNLISSVVLGERSDNSTVVVTEETLANCGANDCPECHNWPRCDASPGTNITTSTNLFKPPMSQVYILCGMYSAFAVIAFLTIAIFLDTIVLDKHDDKQKKRKLSPLLLLETIKHVWENPYQKLLIPLTMYSGIEQGFIAGDFTKSYISCSIGIWNVGYIMICYGVVDGICSFTFGRLVQYVGYIPLFIIAFVVHMTGQLTLLLWEPEPEKKFVFFIITALWGIGGAVVQAQLSAYYGHLFSGDTEAAFACYRLWESTGFIIAFGYSSFICTELKLYVLIAFLTVGMIGYGFTEVMQRKTNRRSDYISK